jgi:hypothetical protein
MQLTAKEVLLLIPAILLAMASLRADDAFILVPCLVLSLGAFIWICVIHSGPRKWRVAAAIVITSIFSFIGVRFYYRPPKPLHVLTAKEHKLFVDELKSQSPPHEQVRLGCPTGKEDECLLVGQFIEVFKEANWEVEHDQVMRTEPGKPMAGLALFIHADHVPEHLPAGQGVWTQQTPSAEIVRQAFERIGIKSQYTADGTMPQGTIGVYFGPDM